MLWGIVAVLVVVSLAEVVRVRNDRETEGRL